MPEVWQPHHFVGLIWRKVLNKNKKKLVPKQKKQVLISTWQQKSVANLAKANKKKKEVELVAFSHATQSQNLFLFFLLCSKRKLILFIYFFFFLKTVFKFYLFFFSCQLLHT